jgi:hypothetical protein
VPLRPHAGTIADRVTTMPTKAVGMVGVAEIL